MKDQFLLRDNITFLNFGSFGACPKPVFKRYQEFQLELEQEPVQFITVKGPQYLKQSREALGKYINANADDIVFVPNPTFAVNIIAKNFSLNKDDEVLSTNIEYGACDRTWDYYCKKAGAVYKRQPINFPLSNKEDFIKQFSTGINSKTKLIFISHITSSTGLRLPVEEICAIAKQKGILIFIDGAHAPGQIPVDLQASDVDFYSGACHKWMMTPKGSSFLFVKKDLQKNLDPLVISWGYQALFPSDSQFLDYHQFNGTRDFSAYLTIPQAIDFMQQNNWDKVSDDCRKLVKENAHELCRILNTSPISSLTDDFVLQLFSAPVKTAEPEKLKQHLYEKCKIEIPVMRQNDKVYLRYSINAMNTQADLDKLFESIKKIKKETNLIET